MFEQCQMPSSQMIWGSWGPGFWTSCLKKLMLRKVIEKKV